MNSNPNDANNFSDQSRPRSEQELRIDELKLKVQEVTEGEFSSGYESPDCPPDVKEAFWEHILAYESAPYTTQLKRLEKAGVTMPAAEVLGDDELSVRLWEVLRKLAELQVFLSCTDHLSDRELYEYLRTEGLCEEAPDIFGHAGGGWYLDVLGSGSEEDMYLHMKYYADEEYRQRWAKDWPDFDMPLREKPPYQRDWLLPQGGLGVSPEDDEG